MTATGNVLQEIIIDQWASLDYKRLFHEGRAFTAPTWVGDHQRRLAAYVMLHAYRANFAREWLDTSDVEKKKQRREYGDADLIIETIVAAILGNEPTIRVAGAGEVDTEAEKDPKPVNTGADKLQEWFDDWADKEMPLLTILEGEDDAVSVGDCVYHVSVDHTKGRPTISEYDPGMYFPVLDEGDPRDYPRKVHIAFEFERTNPSTGEKNRFVRRMTWELVSLTDLQAVDTLALPESGSVTRNLPWNEGATGITCLWTDATWPLNDLKERRVNDFDLSSAKFEETLDGEGNIVEVNALDLGIDFIPVVHVPNTVARKLHYGKSSLQTILQILDELAAADTDLALSARTTGFPPIGVGGNLERGSDGKTITTYGPGTVFEGEVNVVDTSRSLDALIKYIEFLLKRLSSNTRLPESVLGRVDISSNIAGITLALSFGPLRSMITKMRMVRDEKYPLLWKMVARFAMQMELIAPDANMPAIKLDFGTYLPADPKSVVEYVAAALAGKIISRLTAVQILVQDGGFPIDDAEAEVKRIQHEDFEGAKQLAEALADETPAFEPPPPPAPEVQPPVPGGPGPIPAPPVNLPPPGPNA
jgi:hypothetical protein